MYSSGSSLVNTKYIQLTKNETSLEINERIFLFYLHDRDDLLNLLLAELSGPLVQRDVGLLQDNVGVP